MPKLDFSAVPDILLEQYGPAIVDALNPGQVGLGNWLVPEQTAMGRIMARGRMLIGGADGNDRYPRDWGVHAETAESQSFGPDDPYPLHQNETYDKANLEWKREGISLEVDNLDRLTGGNALRGGRNLLQQDFEKKLKALIAGIEKKLFLDGTGNSNKDVTGFKAFLSNSNTYATIDQSGATYWQALVDSSGGGLSKAKMDAVYEGLFDRNIDENSYEIWMPVNQFHRWQQEFQGQIEYRAASDATRQGMIPVYADGAVEIPIRLMKGVPSTEVWWMSMDDLELRFVDHTPEDELSNIRDEEKFHEGVPVGIEVVPTGKDSKGLFLKAYPQLVCMNPKNFAIMTGLTP